MRIITITIIIIYQSLQIFSTKYTNYTLYKTVPTVDKHLNFLKNLSNYYKVDFWKKPGLLNMPVQFLIAPQDKKSFLRLSASHNLHLMTITEDVQRFFDKQNVKTYLRADVKSFNWKSYYQLYDIYNWMTDLNKTYSEILNVYSIGRTIKNRSILCAKIKHKGSTKRSTVIIEGGIHAREWISPAFVTYMMYNILTTPTAQIKNIAELYEWYFVPVLNPDGYQYSHMYDRMWRKNLNNVDLNRNFDASFGTIGVGKNKSSENYPGPFAFSEMESLAMSKFVKALSVDLEYYLSFHSFGQLIILPYAYSKLHEDNFDEVQRKSIQACKIIKRRFGKKYTTGTLYNNLGYLASGVSACWVKKIFRVPYVMTFELRDEGDHGFALPSEEILPTCMETLDGLLYILTPQTAHFKKISLLRNGDIKVTPCSILIYFFYVTIYLYMLLI